MAITKYVPRFEADEIKSAVEIAEEEYRRAADETDKAGKICQLILNKCGEYNSRLDALNKKFRKTAGIFKRSTRSDTRRELYYEMMNLRSEIENLEPAIDNLQKMHDAFHRQYASAYDRELKAKQAALTARLDAGLKFSVIALVETGSKTIPLRADVKTIAEAVTFIYQNAEGLCNWMIFTECVAGLTTRRNTIAEGSTLCAETFGRLIQRLDDHTEFVEAEIVVPQKKTTTRYASPADEFNAIAFRAIHYFTLGDFLTPIAELRAFCRKSNLPAAQSELAEWIQMATAAGIEVPDEERAAFEEIAELEERQGKFRYRNGLKFAVETTIATLDGIFSELVFQKSGALIQQFAAAKSTLERDIARMETNLRRLNPADMLTLAKANIYADLLDSAKCVLDFLNSKPVEPELVIETFALAPADLSAVENFASDKTIRDMQFALCTATSWLSVIELRAGTVTSADLKRRDSSDCYSAAPVKSSYIPQAEKFANRSHRTETIHCGRWGFP